MILDKTDPHAYRGNYIRIHVPTGNRYPDWEAFSSRNSFLETMDNWNRSMPKVWQYTEVPREELISYIMAETLKDLNALSDKELAEVAAEVRQGKVNT